MKGEGFDNLLPHKLLPTTKDNIQLEFTFHSLRKKAQALMADHKLKCGDPHAQGSHDEKETGLRARYIMIVKGVTLYSLNCRRKEAQLAADWDPHTCF